MATDHNGIRLVNVYAPSSTAKRADREFFFNSELPELLNAPSHSIIIGGDFNYILQPADTTGQYTTSSALSEIVRGLNLIDAWQQDPQRPSFTHHSPSGSTRIDRFYATQEVMARKTGIDILPTAFTDHEAVVFRLSIPTNKRLRRRGRWKTDPTLVTEAYIKEKIKIAWEKWRRTRRYYPDEIMWWERCVKTQLQRLLRQEEAERRANHSHMEEHLYECIYDILSSNIPATERFNALQRYKAKLVRLHATRRNQILLDVRENDKVQDEEPSLFHVLRMRRRRAAREITQVTDVQGNTHTTPSAIDATFVSHLRTIYKQIDVDESPMDTMWNVIRPVCPTTYTALLEAPITYDELTAALKAGARHKSPGIDGLSLEFYSANWNTIRAELLQLLNHMFLNKHLSSRQKHGIVVCLPSLLTRTHLTIIAQSPF
jgi:hypothetical protein